MKRYLIFSLIFSFAVAGTLKATTRDRAFIPDNNKLSLKKSHFTPGEKIGEMHVGDLTFTVIAPPQDYKKPGSVGVRSEIIPTSPIISTAPGSIARYTKDISVAYSQMAPLQGIYGLAFDIKWDGNDAYFKDIISIAPPIGNYVKATKKGNKITMPTNQTLLTFEGDDLDEGEEPYAMNFGLLRPVFTRGDDGNIYIWYQYSDDYDQVTYTVASDGSIRLDQLTAKYDYGEFEGQKDNPYLVTPAYAVGYYYDTDKEWTSWTGYCEWTQDYYPFNYPEVEVPASLSWDTFSYINAQGLGVIVNVGETSDAIYFKGLSAYLPQGVFKAEKINEGKISVEPGQFIGTEYDLYYVITNTGVWDEKEKAVYPAPEGEKAYFIVNRDSNGKITSIIADPDSEYFLVFDDDPGYFYDMDSFRDLTLNSQDSFAGTPSDPYNLDYNAHSDFYEHANYIFFKLSPFAANGDIIDINKLYYSIFLNGEPFEFEEQVGEDFSGKVITMYAGIKKPTKLIPYTFFNDLDLYEDNGGTFIVALYSEGIETVGVEAIYVWDGVATYSNLITQDAETGEITVLPGSDAKVETINPDDVVNVEYFDLQGRKIHNPTKGIFIKKYTFSDGTSKTRKVLVY